LWGYRPLSPEQQQYAAIDARASLLLYNKLQPEVLGKHFNNIKRTYKNIHGKDDLLIATTDYSAEAAAVENEIPQVYFTVSDYEVDIDNLRKHWLGKPAPRKDGVVKVCKDPKDAVSAKNLYSSFVAAVVNGGDASVVESLSENDFKVCLRLCADNVLT
jgi:hypothetical protein